MSATAWHDHCRSRPAHAHLSGCNPAWLSAGMFSWEEAALCCHGSCMASLQSGQLVGSMAARASVAGSKSPTLPQRGCCWPHEAAGAHLPCQWAAPSQRNHCKSNCQAGSCLQPCGAGYFSGAVVAGRWTRDARLARLRCRQDTAQGSLRLVLPLSGATSSDQSAQVRHVPNQTQTFLPLFLPSSPVFF